MYTYRIKTCQNLANYISKIFGYSTIPTHQYQWAPGLVRSVGTCAIHRRQADFFVIFAELRGVQTQGRWMG